jgi:hypothetical protein
VRGVRFFNEHGSAAGPLRPEAGFIQGKGGQRAGEARTQSAARHVVPFGQSQRVLRDGKDTAFTAYSGPAMTPRTNLGLSSTFRIPSAILLALSLACTLAACGDDDDDDGGSVRLTCGSTECSSSQYCLTRTDAAGAATDSCEARPASCTGCDCIQPDNCASKGCVTLGDDISVTCS